MSLGKVARKLKRVGKSACQFRFTSKFEYIDLDCSGSWRPDKLRVIWLRNHRRVQSVDVDWVPTEDRGPHGAEGRATFDPPIAVALIITLYRDASGAEFEEKEYKYYVESDGPNGKKILASFNCDVAEYAGVPSTRHTLDMTFKTVSKKISKSVLGITLESEYIKQGSATDDDMQSTFSAYSTGHDSLTFEDDEDEGEDGRKTFTPLDKVLEVSEPGLDTHSLITLGTGETLKRQTLPYGAPPKPPRSSSVRSIHQVQLVDSEDSPVDPMEVPTNGVPAERPTVNHDAANGAATEEVVASKLDSESEVSKLSKPEIVLTDSTGPVNVTAPQNQGTSGKDMAPLKLSSTKGEEATPVVGASSTEEAWESELTHTSVEQNGEQETERSTDVTTSMALEKKAKGFIEKVEGMERLDSFSILEMTTQKPTAAVELSAADLEGSEPGLPSEENQQGDDERRMGDQSGDHLQNGGQQEESHHENYEHQQNGVTDVVEHSQQNEGVAQADQPELESGGGNEVEDDDFWFETSRLLATQFSQHDSLKGAAANSSPSSSSKNRVSIQSKETYKAPPNPYLDDKIANGEDEELPPPSPTAAWLGDAMLIDCFGEPVGREKLDDAKIIGMYFSANWCPPCRRFLPKLVKFYHHLKQHGKSFEILYISSDYSKQEMTKYMQDQQMPWVGLAFDSSMADKLRTDFSVSAIPLFTVVTCSGTKIEESAKKSVEGATSSSSVLKLYNRWYEKVEGREGEGDGEKKGLLQRMKGAIQKGSSQPEVEQQMELEDRKRTSSQEGEASGTVRHVVETKQLNKSRSKSHVNQEMYEQKEKQVQHLEEVNMSLKQTNDDLNEELAELRRQLNDAQQKLEAMEQSSRLLEDEKRELLANLNIRGWLCKRGLKGPTANVWRRRFFRCDQGSKIYYYKSASEGAPQGFIDLDKVISVQEVSAAQQDKNHATFLVQCDGRTFQLQAHDEATMRKWMSAIEYLTDWRKRHTNGAMP